MADDELRRLRAEAAKRHRAATNKISRLKNDVGVELSGTKEDPRRDKERLKSYNRRQLRAYIRNLNRFVDRSNQYVPDANARPVRRDLWRQYKAQEQAFNRRVQSHFEKYKDIFIPEAGMTVGERMHMVTPLHRYMRNTQAVNSLYDPIERDPKQIRDERALRKLRDSYKDRNDPAYFTRRTQAGRDLFKEFMDTAGRSDLVAMVDELSDAQFDLAWDYSGLASAAAHSYWAAKNMVTARDKARLGDEFDAQISTVEEILRWAGETDVDG